MKVVLSEKEITEAIKEWCNRRFPLDEKASIRWETHLIDARSNTHRLEFTISGVEIPPKDGPYR